MKELVKALSTLTADAPPGLRREAERPFAGLWDFDRNAALWSQPLRVEHLMYVLTELEALFLAGKEVTSEVAIREIHHDVRRLIMKTPLANVQNELSRNPLLIRGVEG